MRLADGSLVGSRFRFVWAIDAFVYAGRLMYLYFVALEPQDFIFGQRPGVLMRLHNPAYGASLNDRNPRHPHVLVPENVTRRYSGIS